MEDLMQRIELLERKVEELERKEVVHQALVKLVQASLIHIGSVFEGAGFIRNIESFIETIKELSKHDRLWGAEENGHSKYREKE